MKCSKCQYKIICLIKCPKCGNNLCSQECLSRHNYTYHGDASTGISDPEPTIKKNISQNILKESLFPPPFFNYNEIKYSPLYDLINFSLIYKSDGKPKTLGKGSFGQVFLAKNDIDNKIYAIKHMEKQILFNYFNSLEPIYSEINIQSRINHPNIIKLLFVKETKTGFDLVMEYAPGGTLFNFIIKNKGLSEDFSYNFFIQIVYAIKFLHENKIIHRDIKPENILLFEENTVKLCDFGWAIQTDKKLPPDSFFGTVEYMSPEIINHKSYDKKMDLWTLGILLYELIHSFSPFRPKKKEFSEDEVIENIRKHDIEFYTTVSKECKKLIVGLLEYDENKRYTIDDILNSDFVKIHEKIELKKSFLIINDLKNDNNNKNNEIYKHNKFDDIKTYKEKVIFNNKKTLHKNGSFNNDVKKLRQEFQIINTVNNLKVKPKSVKKYIREKIIISNSENQSTNNILLNKHQNHSTSNDILMKFDSTKNQPSTFFRSILAPSPKIYFSEKTEIPKNDIFAKSTYEKIRKYEPSDNNENIDKLKINKSKNFQIILKNVSIDKNPSDNMRNKYKKLKMNNPKKIEQEPKDNNRNFKTKNKFISHKNIQPIQLKGKNIKSFLFGNNNLALITENQNKKPVENNKKFKKEKSQLLSGNAEKNRNNIINKILNDLKNYKSRKVNKKFDKVLIDDKFNRSNKNTLTKKNTYNKINNYKKKCSLENENGKNGKFDSQIKLQTSPDVYYTDKKNNFILLENSENTSTKDRPKNVDYQCYSEYKKDINFNQEKLKNDKGNADCIFLYNKNGFTIE